MKSVLNAIPRSREQLTAKVQSLKADKAAQGAFWVVLGSGGGQIVRIASNLILTRLLFPEIFGLMALVTAVMVFLGQVSDVGLREGVVNSDRIKDPVFMRTAWTLQILRTGAICLFACIIAWPFASFYGEPVLAPVLIMISTATFLTGFKSIALLEYDKRLDLKKQIISDIGVQIAGIVVVIVWCLISPSIWALVAGQLFSSALEVLLSYKMFTGHNSKFGWDKAAVSKLFGYGKWIFVSSTISFITVQGDRLIMGKFISMGELGKYTLAANWAAIVTILSVSLSTRVLHPYFRMAIEGSVAFSRIHTVRNLLNSAYTLVCVGLAIMGDWLIIFLYDDRYKDAGWMLQVLAIGQLAKSFTGTLMPFILANGDSFSQMKFSTYSAFILAALMFLGGHYGGAEGIIITYALTGIVAHPIMIYFARRHGYKCFFEDLGLMVLAIILAGTGWWLVDASILHVLEGLIQKL